MNEEKTPPPLYAVIIIFKIQKKVRQMNVCACIHIYIDIHTQRDLKFKIDADVGIFV
jgi:hypothetical protein